MTQPVALGPSQPPLDVPALVSATENSVVLVTGLDKSAQDREGRPRRLEAAVDGADLILPVRRLAAEGLEAWELVKECGYEGLVAKDGASPYQAGESRSWVKVKVRQDGRFLVGGIGETADRAPRLFLGEEVEGEVVYRGTVDRGVGRALVAELLKRGRQRRTSPFELLRSRRVTWLEPTVAVEVTYGRRQQGWLREPACRGLADDVQARRVLGARTRGAIIIE